MTVIKNYCKKLRSGEPGRRFRDFYNYRNEHRADGPAPSRAITIAVGVALLLFGIAVGWLPGPGGVVGILGIAILAAEFKPLAGLLDTIEADCRKFLGAIRDKWLYGGAIFRRSVVIIGIGLVIAAGALAVRAFAE
jgi:hypothetical protein